MKPRARLAFLAAGTLLASSACAPREVLLPKLGLSPPRLNQFPADFAPPLSSETDQPMPGFGGGGGGVTRTPVIFIHGNTVSARFWWPAREAFIEEGWTADELWAFGYGWDSVRWFDSNDLSVPGIERVVTAVTRYLSQKTGREIRQVDIVAHSLGVTAVRQWMKQNNAWHRVRNFVGVAGANHGVWTARLDARGQNRVTAFELAPGSPWLEQLNRDGETPGSTRYLTLYDGTGRGDELFPSPHEHSPRLQGAGNVPFNLEHGTGFDHLELPRRLETIAVMADFLKAAGEPLPQAPPPRLIETPRGVRADEGLVFCADGGAYPDRARPGVAEFRLEPGALTTCFARSPRTGLSSPMRRFLRTARTPSKSAPVLTAEPSGGQFEGPLDVHLGTNDPEAYIVYTTSGAEPDSGSPLYASPIHVAGPLKLRAVAITPEGQRSAPLHLNFDVSLELLEARHTLQRQFEPDAPVEAAGKRRKGR